MKPQTARTFVILAAILLLFAATVLSPAAGFLLSILAALAAVVPIFLGTKSFRIAGSILLILALFFAASLYPKFKNEQKRYVGGAKKDATVQDRLSTAQSANK